jgi:hypothetical protein
MSGQQYWIAMQQSSNAVDNRERVGGIGYYKGSYGFGAFEANATMITVAGLSITCNAVLNVTSGATYTSIPDVVDTGLRVS